MSVGRKSGGRVGHDCRSDSHPVAVCVAVIQAELEGHALIHTSAAANQSDRELVSLADAVFRIKCMAWHGVRPVNRIVILEDAHVLKSKNKRRLHSIAIVYISARRKWEIVELAHSIFPRRKTIIRGIIPSRLRRLLPRIHIRLGEWIYRRNDR